MISRKIYNIGIAIQFIQDLEGPALQTYNILTVPEGNCFE